MRTFWYAGLLLLTGILLFACQSGDLNVGQSVINPQELTIQSIDTITVRSSTVMKPDSFITSADNDILVGRWSDPQSGQLSMRAFAELDYTANTLSTQTNLVLDSLVLEMNYSFVYGDTTSAYSINVHRLTKPLVPQLYYNTSSVPYEATPFLQKTVLPQPQSRGKQIRLRTSDALAQSFYSQLLSGQINDAQSLEKFLPGFAFISTSTNNTIAGFSAAAGASGLRLYYHTVDDAQTAVSLLFPIASLHFTKFITDFTGTPLSALKSRSDAVNSRLTDNTTFIALGAGLQTRIEFPYLNQFDRPVKFADINKALLVISPVRRSLQDNTPPPGQALIAGQTPDAVELYVTNNQNQVIATVPGGTNPLAAVAATTYYSYDANSPLISDSYTFDLTYYLGQILKQKSLPQPLILTVPTPNTGYFSMKSLVQRVVLGNQQRPNDQMQVKLFITSGT
ncbi:DUF4270 family protein [Spirosoma endophyticum]|uniref:DUF4270 domain-containing protein n=1 Tax=Spirosoma endophyticum TaxID=662367 RepID=A0A1I1GZR7_9BACT|nr:DUF4270 family protein [Spirosoma endophyticum]SFC14450.1 protein of unknown function [Spirosoma endophyticum]